ncbi:MAG: cytochrome c oxidase subunit 3 [Proteobacteria bacterium]|jgi:Heme/copper-type cytochrome/quinol oxidase, subunit 3|nr:MAG: cytochrome c oxidase subunit 3 [Pseudomonadota bacterium]
MADSHAKHHDYHLVDPSPWPLLASLSALVMAIGFVIWMHSMNGGPGVFGIRGSSVFFIGAIALVAMAFFWWRDVVREAHSGHHTPVVQLHLRYGMILFITTEVMFFVAWFWAYFDAALFPGDVHPLPITLPDGTVEASDQVIGMVQRNELTGGQWPPVPSDTFKSTFDPWGLPLVNTLILLLSGTTVTWAHHSLLQNDRKGLVWGLTLTVALGAIFTMLQAYEYGHAAFNYAGHIYGATFFMATGFHGAHVIIGTIFLLVCLLRALKGHFTPKQHFGFEAAAWYWHFVDVVWLFLFACIYVWGAGTPAGH